MLEALGGQVQAMLGLGSDIGDLDSLQMELRNGPGFSDIDISGALLYNNDSFEKGEQHHDKKTQT